MSGFNQKGPEGQGPMTGRRIGRCTAYGAGLKNKSTTISDKQTEDQPLNLLARDFGLRWNRGRGRGSRGCGLGQQNRFRGRILDSKDIKW